MNKNPMKVTGIEAIMHLVRPNLKIARIFPKFLNSCSTAPLFQEETTHVSLQEELSGVPSRGSLVSSTKTQAGSRLYHIVSYP